MPPNPNRSHSRGAGKAAQNSPETALESHETAAAQSETPGALPMAPNPPPAPSLVTPPGAALHGGATSTTEAHGAQRGQELDPAPQRESAAAGEVSQAIPVSTRKRGKAKIRHRWQVRERLNELAGKLERGEVDPKTGAILVQTYNGVLACLNAEAAEDVDKRLAAVEERMASRPAQKGASA